MKALRNISLLLLVFLASFVQAQVENMSVWKTQTWNLDLQDKEELSLLSPTAEEEILADDGFWQKLEGSDTLFVFRPSNFGFKKDYSYNAFIAKVLDAGYTPAPKQALVEIYLKGEDMGEPIHLSTTCVKKSGRSFIYAVGPNDDKRSTPTKKKRDLFLKDESKLGDLDLWLFMKKRK